MKAARSGGYAKAGRTLNRLAEFRPNPPQRLWFDERNSIGKTDDTGPR